MVNEHTMNSTWFHLNSDFHQQKAKEIFRFSNLKFMQKSFGANEQNSYMKPIQSTRINANEEQGKTNCNFLCLERNFFFERSFQFRLLLWQFILRLNCAFSTFYSDCAKFYPSSELSNKVTRKCNAAKRCNTHEPNCLVCCDLLSFAELVQCGCFRA